MPTVMGSLVVAVAAEAHAMFPRPSAKQTLEPMPAIATRNQAVECGGDPAGSPRGAGLSHGLHAPPPTLQVLSLTAQCEVAAPAGVAQQQRLPQAELNRHEVPETCLGLQSPPVQN